MREGFAPLEQSASSLLVMSLAFAALLGLRLVDAIDNWTFVIGLVVIPLVAAIVATLSAAATQRTRARLAETEAATPLEWVGIDRPWRDSDLEALDAVLGASDWEPHGAA